MKKPYANDAIKIISDVSLKFLNDVLAIMTSRKINRLLTLTWLRCICEKPFEAPHSVVKRTTQHAFQMHGKSIHFNGISAILLHDFRLYHKALSVWWQFKCESACWKRSNYKENRYGKRVTNSLERHMLGNYGVIPWCTICYSKAKNAKFQRIEKLLLNRVLCERSSSYTHL